MRFYRVVIDGNEKPIYESTLADAHETAKKTPKMLRGLLYIDEIEVDTSKKGVRELIINGAPVIQAVLRSWNLSPRGGLNLVKD